MKTFFLSFLPLQHEQSPHNHKVFHQVSKEDKSFVRELLEQYQNNLLTSTFQLFPTEIVTSLTADNIKEIDFNVPFISSINFILQHTSI